MNVSFEKKDELNAIISVIVTNDDYQENLNKQFKDYRKKARFLVSDLERYLWV